MGAMVRNPRLTFPIRADLSTQGPSLDSNSPILQLSSTPSDPNRNPQVGSNIFSSTPSDPNSSPQAGSGSRSTTSPDPNSNPQAGSYSLSPPPSIRRRSSKTRTGFSDHESLAME